MGDRNDVHSVRITRPFYLGVFHVTQAEYQVVMKENPSCCSGTHQGTIFLGQNTSRFPVENVSWNDAQEFCRKLSESTAEVEAMRRYRLPTEAEWEYAWRAGESLSVADATASGTWPVKSSIVDSYPPNSFGLCGMHCNVCEFCQDYYGDYDTLDSIDPKGPKSGSLRVLRGRKWGSGYFRNGAGPDQPLSIWGVRLVCELALRT